jgi:UPF0271 protein
MKSPINNQRRKIVVLDTSAFLAGFDPFSLGEEQVTVPEVEEEIKRNTLIKTRFETAVESGRLRVKAPSEEAVTQAKVYACNVGDSFKLSQADMQLLSLALELKKQGYSPQLVTDDYSIQNVAKQMGIEFVALATFGIKRLLEWIRYCPACHRKYPVDCTFKECQICGTELKRKPSRPQKPR